MLSCVGGKGDWVGIWKKGPLRINRQTTFFLRKSPELKIVRGPENTLFLILMRSLLMVAIGEDPLG